MQPTGKTTPAAALDGSAHERPRFAGGTDIALKIPADRFAETLAFYRDVLGPPPLGADGTSESFRFGPIRLWLDRVEHASQTDVWLKLATADLQARGVPVRDGVEPLGDSPGH